MEHSLRGPTRPSSESLHLPKGVISGGVERGFKLVETDSSDKGSETRRPPTRMPLGAEVFPLKAVSRQAENAVPLEGDGEISLQRGPVAEQPAEHSVEQSKVTAEASVPDVPPPVGDWLGHLPGEKRYPVANLAPMVVAAVVGEKPRSSSKIELVCEQTTPGQQWLRAESVRPLTPPAEVIAAKPLTELLAAPAAAVALKSAGEKAPSSVGKMGKAEMLALSGTIKVDGMSLRDLYESGQLDDEGLKSAIEVYLRGGDVAQQVQFEIIEKQKQFERDPFIRRRSGDQARDNRGGASQKIVEAAGGLAKTASSVASKASRTLNKRARKAQQKLADGSETQQWVGIGIVVLIWAVILWLVFG